MNADERRQNQNMNHEDTEGTEKNRKLKSPMNADSYR